MDIFMRISIEIALLIAVENNASDFWWHKSFSPFSSRSSTFKTQEQQFDGNHKNENDDNEFHFDILRCNEIE